MNGPRWPRWLALVALLASPSLPAQSMTAVLRGTLSLGGTAVDQFGQTFNVTGLSGITHLGDGRFVAVMDNSRRLVFLDVVLAADGSPMSATITHGLTLPTTRDFEGIAWSGPAGGSVHLSEEGTPAVREYSLTDGALLRVHPTPAVFTAPGNLVGNKGFESLALRADGVLMLVANEEALTVDGILSTSSQGTVVRIVSYAGVDGDFVPVAQHAYVTEPLHGLAISGASSGLVELVILPQGGVLALERSFALGLGLFRTALFEVDFTNATDVSLPPHATGLSGTAYTPVVKHQLLSTPAVGQNLEGLALGPPLPSGGVALVGVVDDGDPLSANMLVTFQLNGPTVSATPCGGPCPIVGLTTNAPVSVGGTLTLGVSAPSLPLSPLLLVADVTPGPVVVPAFGNVMVALTPALLLLAGPSGGGLVVASPALTDASGQFGLALPLPAAPSLAGLRLYAQAAVVDVAPAGLAIRPSNPIVIEIQ